MDFEAIRMLNPMPVMAPMCVLLHELQRRSPLYALFCLWICALRYRGTLCSMNASTFAAKKASQQNQLLVPFGSQHDEAEYLWQEALSRYTML